MRRWNARLCEQESIQSEARGALGVEQERTQRGAAPSHQAPATQLARISTNLMTAGAPRWTTRSVSGVSTGVARVM